MTFLADLNVLVCQKFNPLMTIFQFLQVRLLIKKINNKTNKNKRLKLVPGASSQ